MATLRKNNKEVVSVSKGRRLISYIYKGTRLIWSAKNTDWGGDASTDNLPVAGSRVQEFAKTTLNKKAGAFLFDESKNSYLVFADADKIKPMSERGFEASGKFEDVEVGRVLYEKGLIASPTKSSVKELGEITSLDSVFSGNTTLTKFPELKHCIAITSLTNTFYGCINLMEAPAIPRSVTSMNGTFNRCTRLLEAPIIPRGITTMKDTFKGAYYLDGKYTIKAINPPVYEGVFEADRITSIYVPAESVDIYKNASGWIALADKIKPIVIN